MTQRKRDFDVLQALFEYGVDVDNRRVWLVGEITEASGYNAIKGLYLLDTIADKPVELFINSPGGDVVEALAVYDIVQTLRCPVWTFAFGKCESAAPLLLAMGEPGHRWVADNVELMVHNYSSEMDGKGSDLRAFVQQSEAVFDRYLELLAKHAKKNLPFWRGLVRKTHDAYFDSEQAIEWGLADSVWRER